MLLYGVSVPSAQAGLLISELLTYSTNSRHGGQAKAGSAAPLAQPQKNRTLGKADQHQEKRGRR